MQKDITEVEKLREENFKKEKLDTVATLAAGIAHDFNNFLTALFGNIELATMFSKEAKVKELLNKAIKSGENAQKLVSQLLTFTKIGVPAKELFSLKEFIIESVNFILTGKNIKAKFQINEDLWNVEANQSQLNQVINNIVINAVESMPNGGEIIVSCENVTINNRDTNINNQTCKIKNGDFVKISIQDFGSGIETENIDKIFDPFFTTKSNGNGLGLAMSYRIIENHGGCIILESEINKGTTFNILLPASVLKNNM